MVTALARPSTVREAWAEADHGPHLGDVGAVGYSEGMTAPTTQMDPRGRVTIPAELRERLALSDVPGDALMVVETERGLLLTTRSQTVALLRGSAAGRVSSEELIAERRAAAKTEEAELGAARQHHAA